MTTKPKAKLPNPAPPPDAKHEPIELVGGLPIHSAPLASIGKKLAAPIDPRITCTVCGNPVVNRCEVCGHEAP